MGVPEAWKHTRSRYARLMMRKSGYHLADLHTMAERLRSVDFEVELHEDRLVCEQMDLELSLNDRFWRIETRRIGPIDRAVDEAFVEIIKRHRYREGEEAKARCSDCYACCKTDPSTFIYTPQVSLSCRLTQRLFPSKHRVS